MYVENLARSVEVEFELIELHELPASPPITAVRQRKLSLHEIIISLMQQG